VTANAVAAFLFVVVAVTACGAGHRPELIAVPGKPGHLIEVNDHHLYFECAGVGKPTVLLEAGYGADHTSWDAVEPELAKTTRTCEYDRAGLGLSAAERPKPRGAVDQLDDLDELLDGAGIDPPYVVVGHSYGGLLAWFFARRHRGDVDGLLLLDSSHPQQVKRFRAVLGKAHLAEPEQVSPENVRFSTAAAKLRDLGSLGGTRLVVMTAGEADMAELPKRAAARVGRIWRDLQDDYARRSTDSVHVVAVYSPHFIQSYLGQPELVVRAVRELVAAARADRPLRECRRLFRPPGAACISG
jgi:pimeloyl-ACP methyl ester carboxylesterase